MISIYEEKIISTDGSGTARVADTLIVSASADLPAADGLSGRILVPGSIAVVPSESKIFVLDTDDEWKEWGADDSGTSANALTASIDRTALTGLRAGLTDEEYETDGDEDEVSGAAESE